MNLASTTKFSLCFCHLLELSKVLISQKSSKNWCEVTEERESMVDDCRIILRKVQFGFEVDHKNG
jgi:hypothetical protein